MTFAGWTFMAVSITAVLTLVVCCYARILRQPAD
jgi:hypothetical protein